jgi:hypothetical protein
MQNGSYTRGAYKGTIIPLISNEGAGALSPINILLRSVIIYYIKVRDRVAGEKLAMHGSTREIKPSRDSVVSCKE